jgi:2'-hydroxyisoflavone reductase
MAEAGQIGTFNATGPDTPLAMARLLEACRAAAGSDATFTWISDEFLLAHEVGAWMELPLWIPESDAAFAGFLAVDCRRAIAAGLTFRPLAETACDTLAWDATRPADREWKAGLRPEREAELLAAWHAL